ncbi:MAG: PilW family protein [Rubrivivax sp.]
MRPAYAARRRRAGAPLNGLSRGFTLVEVMVALAIGVLILLALAIMFARNNSNQTELERTTRQLENGRFALDLLTEDIMHAGFYGDFNPDTMITASAYLTPGPCPATVTDLGWVTPGGGAAPSLPVAVQGIPAATPIGCGAAAADRQSGTQALSIRHAETSAVLTPASITPGNLYVQASRCKTDLSRILVGSATADFTLRLPACDAINVRVRRAVQRTYYIARCNDCATGDGIPTLRRLEWIDGQLRDTPLAEGVENLQLEFGIDDNGDGWPDQFVDAGDVTGVAPLLWTNVVAVRAHLLTRTTEPTAGYIDPRTYTIGAVVVTPADSYKRVLLSSTVRLHNVGGRRE